MSKETGSVICFPPSCMEILLCSDTTLSCVSAFLIIVVNLYSLSNRRKFIQVHFIVVCQPHFLLRIISTSLLQITFLSLHTSTRLVNFTFIEFLHVWRLRHCRSAYHVVWRVYLYSSPDFSTNQSILFPHRLPHGNCTEFSTSLLLAI